MAKKRIMRRFRLSEISAVDNPAQKGARMTIMKRDQGGEQLTMQIAEGMIALKAEGKSLPEAFSETLTEETYNKVESALQALDSVFSDDLEFGKVAVEEFVKSSVAFWPTVEVDLAKAFPPKKEEEEDEATDADEAELESRMQDDEDERTCHKGANDMTPEEKKAAEAKKSADEAEAKKAEEAKEAAAKKAADEAEAAKAAAAEEAKKNDEVITIEGTEVRKSEVGAAQFAVFKATAERLSKAEAELVSERDRREMAEFSKRAEDELPSLPGDTLAKAKVLKAISKMSDEDKLALETMLKGGEKAMKGGFEALGHKGGKSAADGASFMKKVAEIKSRDNCSQTEALSKARLENPEEFTAYQSVN